ncbi:unnamed protein product [Gadus morhua 'NCC']
MKRKYWREADNQSHKRRGREWTPVCPTVSHCVCSSCQTGKQCVSVTRTPAAAAAVSWLRVCYLRGPAMPSQRRGPGHRV